MPYLSSELSALVASQHGVVAAEQLIDDGLRRSTIRRLVTAGALVRVHHGVYRVATSPDGFESRCVAACLADRDAVITGPAAARLWEFRHVFRPDRPDVLVPHDRSPITSGVMLRRTNVLDEIDVVERGDAIRVAAPPRAWFDCARDLADDRFERLTEWVLDHHATIPTLWATVRRLHGRGRPGLARVRRVLSFRHDWQRPAGSGLEVDVLRALERCGIGPLVRQYPLRLQNGTVIHPDAADPGIRWALEVDHVTWHGGRFDAQRDKARDRQARKIRWQVDRVTDQELREDFDGTIREVSELYFQRAAEVPRAA